MATVAGCAWGHGACVCRPSGAHGVRTSKLGWRTHREEEHRRRRLRATILNFTLHSILHSIEAAKIKRPS